MPEPTPPAAPAADPAPEPITTPPAEPGGLPANNPEGEGTTPEEVAKVLKSSGMDLPIDTPAPVDEEEGDDPDAPAEPVEPTPATDEEEVEEPPKRTPPPVAAEDIDDKYSIQVTDANGTTYKIPVGAKMEDILKEFEPTNNGQILDILNQLQKLEAQKTADEATAAEESAKTERESRATELLKGWGEEAKELQGAKRIPEGKDGETRVNEVYKFMADENSARIKAGKPTLNSFEDALDKLENKEARDAKVESDKADKETARKNGGLVGGASAPASGGASVYKAGSAKNSNQALRSLGLLE